MHKINHANIKEWAANYDGPLFDGILCDPPYELGFMGKSWDSSGIAFDTDMWADLFKLVKPGGHLLAFSGSRTYHRMACAIEDAGFEIRDMIEWVYGSGFPKSLNIGKAVDKQNGSNGFRGELKLGGERLARLENGKRDGEGKWGDESGRDPYTYIPETEAAKQYEGYGTALKPAHEPCVLARKPLEGTVANNCLKYGTGGLNIDKCRVPTTELKEQKAKGSNGGEAYGDYNLDAMYTPSMQGRFPSNLIHDGSDEVEAVFPDSKSGSGKATEYEKHGGQWGKGKQIRNADFGDSGSASRFFYTAKASKSERNAGLEGFEERIAGGMAGTADQTLLTGSGNIRNNKAQNHHPTVKPLSLTKYLATLIKPPTGGRLLVPFSGSGSEMIGALQAGWEYVEGVELTEEYIPIAEARIKHWVNL